MLLPLCQLLTGLGEPLCLIGIGLYSNALHHLVFAATISLATCFGFWVWVHLLTPQVSIVGCLLPSFSPLYYLLLKEPLGTLHLWWLYFARLGTPTYSRDTRCCCHFASS